MDNIQLSHQLLNSFCNSLKLNLGKVRGSVLKLFLTSLCLTRLHYDSPVSSLLIKLVQFVCLMENWCNQLSKIPYWTLLISTYSLETFVTVNSFNSFLEFLT